MEVLPGPLPDGRRSGSDEGLGSRLSSPTPANATIGLEQPIDDVLILFLSPSPSLLLRIFLSIKRKSRTSCQPIALALGHSVLVDRKNFRELVKTVHADCRR